MAMTVKPIEIGIDVSKDELVIACFDQPAVKLLSNDLAAIRSWLKSLSAPARIAVEATNTFHLTLVETAHRLGHTVYIVDGYCLNQYRKALRGRAKTDGTDARLLLRFVNREWPDLRSWTPPCKGYQALQRLLHRRATLVRVSTTLRQSLAHLPELKTSCRAVLNRLKQLEVLINRRLCQAINEHGWQADYHRCQAIEGIGPITSAALIMAFNRGDFRSSDAFIAFLGLDVRVRDSGKSRGRRRLTKKGDPELRRLLYLAAMTASHSATWQSFYQRHLDRGLTKIQALVVLARKLARIAFAILRNQSAYLPKPALEVCQET